MLQFCIWPCLVCHFHCIWLPILPWWALMLWLHLLDSDNLLLQLFPKCQCQIDPSILPRKSFPIFAYPLDVGMSVEGGSLPVWGRGWNFYLFLENTSWHPPSISFVSKSVLTIFGLTPESITNYLMTDNREHLKFFLRPYANFCLLNLLTAISVYLMPPYWSAWAKPNV